MLTSVQKEIMRSIAANRSETSYMAGGLVLNRDWPRVSDDMDIFHDTDEEIGAAAGIDIATLRNDGHDVSIEVEVYGLVEAAVAKGGKSTLIQWMSESRTRFFPLVRDAEWGARLHQADLAVNKILAASSRTKARDFVDLASIAERMCPLGPLVLAAAGKPPHFSPQKIIDETRRRGFSVSNDLFDAVKGLPDGWNAALVRDRLAAALDLAERYVHEAPAELVGLLAVNAEGTPVETKSMRDGSVTFRKATAEREVMPSIADLSYPWEGGG